MIGSLINVDQEQREKEQLMDFGLNDHLTGLLNRAASEQQIESHLLSGVGEKPDLLLVIDIDHFKDFNDNFGHLTGDSVLVAMGVAMKETFRDTDVLCRWGGDEFVIFLRGVGGMEHAKACVRRLQEKMKGYSYNGITRPVTLSIGGAASAPDMGLNELFERADKALYRVKEAGRDDFYIVPAREDTVSTKTQRL